jgi:hypothetical protein
MIINALPLRPRISLRTLFLLVTLAGCWLGWQRHVVRQREAARMTIVEGGGWIGAESFTPQPTRAGIPWLRRWLGDEAVLWIRLPGNASESEIRLVESAFPEADVSVGLYPQGSLPF